MGQPLPLAANLQLVHSSCRLVRGPVLYATSNDFFNAFKVVMGFVAKFQQGWVQGIGIAVMRPPSCIAISILVVTGQRSLVLNGVRISNAFLWHSTLADFLARYVDGSSHLGEYSDTSGIKEVLPCMQESVLVGRLHQLKPPALNKRQSFWMIWSGFLALDGISVPLREDAAARHR